MEPILFPHLFQFMSCHPVYQLVCMKHPLSYHPMYPQSIKTGIMSLARPKPPNFPQTAPRTAAWHTSSQEPCLPFVHPRNQGHGRICGGEFKTWIHQTIYHSSHLPLFFCGKKWQLTSLHRLQRFELHNHQVPLPYSLSLCSR